MLIRFIKFLILLVFLLSALTGIRIGLYDASLSPTFVLGWIDTIQYGHNIFNQHLLVGLLLFALVVLLIILGAWQFLRMREVKVAGKPSWVLKKSIIFAIYTLLGTSILSGLLTYSGHIEDFIFYATVVNVHTYSFYGLLALGLCYMIVLMAYRKDPKATEYQTAGSVWATTGIFILSIGAAALCTYGIFKFLEKPAVLKSKNIYRSPVIDGRAAGIEWVGADSLLVILSHGDNFPDNKVQLKVKSFHNFQYIFFLFQWADPEPSFNRSLVKTDTGWKELKSEDSPFGESVYFEDQLAVSFHEIPLGCANSCHLGNSTKTKSHYTEGDTADVWVWKSTSTNPAWEADDGWWGEKINDRVGGRHFDNSPGGGYISNLNEEWDEPYFLPLYHSFDNWIWMESDRFFPYRASLDNYPVGETVPGMLVSRFAGDRSDLDARGQWRSGLWTVELSRRKKTGSSFDVSFRSELWMGLALFDNSEFKHAAHLKPIKFIVEK